MKSTTVINNKLITIIELQVQLYVVINTYEILFLMGYKKRTNCIYVCVYVCERVGIPINFYLYTNLNKTFQLQTKAT